MMTPLNYGSLALQKGRETPDVVKVDIGYVIGVQTKKQLYKNKNRFTRKNLKLLFDTKNN